MAIAPLAIAVHRYVLLKQVTRGYPIGPRNARFIRYAGYAIGLTLLFSISAYYERVANQLVPDFSDLFHLGSTTVLNIVLVIVAMNHAVLFPAVAVDVESMGWRQSRRVMRGHAWRAFFTMLCFVVPIVAMIVPLVYFETWFEIHTDIGPQMTWLVGRIGGLIMLCGFAAVAARLYRSFDPALGREPLPEPTVVAAS